MRTLLYVCVALLAILPNAFSQTPMPEQPVSPSIPTGIQRATQLLSGAGWADAQKLASEREELSTALPELISNDLHSADLIAEKAAGSDLLMQSIYQGLLTATERGIDCKDLLSKIFEKVSKSTDPADIPDRARFWVMRDIMLRNLAIRLVRSVEHRELTADEIVEIGADASGWIKRVYPTGTKGIHSSSPVSNDVETTSSRPSTVEQVAPLVQPPTAKKALEATPLPMNGKESKTSRPWIIMVLIVAAVGVLGWLLKRRS